MNGFRLAAIAWIALSLAAPCVGCSKDDAKSKDESSSKKSSKKSKGDDDDDDSKKSSKKDKSDDDDDDDSKSKKKKKSKKDDDSKDDGDDDDDSKSKKQNNADLPECKRAVKAYDDCLKNGDLDQTSIDSMKTGKKQLLDGIGNEYIKPSVAANTCKVQAEAIEKNPNCGGKGDD
jgi:hypothetical protein